TSKEISDLEGELSSIRNLLSMQATLIHGLAEGVHIDSLSPKASEGRTANGLLDIEDSESSDLEKWSAEFPDLLDVLLAKKRVDEALQPLMKENTAIIERNQKLADQLAEAACQPSTRGAELHASILALKKLAAGGLRAAAECVQIALGHCSLLEAHGLALCPVLLKLFRPSVEQALDANLKRIEESTAVLAAADDWVLTYPQLVLVNLAGPLVHPLATLIHGLAEGVHIDSLSPKASEGRTANGLLDIEDSESSDLEKWSAEFPDLLDVLLAKKRVDEALQPLMKENTAIIERNQKLADQLAEAACQPSTRGAELHASILALKKLAAGGLRAAAECVQIALGHCSLLEAHGLALCPVLLKLFRPSVEQALDANLKRIEESTAVLAAADDWVLTYPQLVLVNLAGPLVHPLVIQQHFSIN
ncbi:hypothetical protein QQP08_018470, partial [Theobroma cacao]